MKASALFLITLAAAVSNTDAFGVGQGIHRQAALSNGVRPVGIGASCRATALQMASEPAGEEIVIEKDFRLSVIFLGGGLLLDKIPFLQVTIGPIATLLGILFLVQTFRLNFVCDDTTFSLQDTSKEETEVGENIVVGGENRWTYDSFVNYDFFPAGWIDEPQGPILVYFKETQTPSDKWNEGPGAGANSDEALAKGAVKGQVHFFPALCNTKQLRSIWEKQNCDKL
mmetsp:Transcript_19853/g.40891  ORF Transcript_19853/g.40891 Transcript_19853/m.40891 type:complete len:227 (-) Transcript_19853:2150-2830(-)